MNLHIKLIEVQLVLMLPNFQLPPLNHFPTGLQVLKLKSYHILHIISGCKVTRYEIYKVTKLKVSNYKREDDDFNRLGTTISSRIIKGSATDKKEFDEAKVRVGDHIVKGTIIGISELNIYQSCKVCWCKVDDEGFCRKCDKKVDNTKPDFNLVMYVQSDDQDDDIIEIFSFNTTLDLKLEKDIDISEDNLNKMMMEMKVKAEYDVDKTRDDGKFKLVKFHMFSSK